MQFKVSQSLRNPNQTANIRRIGHPDGTACSKTCKSVSKLLSLLSSKYPFHGAENVFTENDRIAATYIENSLLDIAKSGRIPQTYYDLEIKGADLIDDSSDSESESEEGDSDEEYDPDDKKKYTKIPYSLNKMKAILDLYDDPKFSGNKLKRVNKRFRFIKDHKQISRIREQVRHCGSRYYKKTELREQFFQEILRCKKEKQVIRDRFLIDASLEIADRLHFTLLKQVQVGY